MFERNKTDLPSGVQPTATFSPGNAVRRFGIPPSAGITKTSVPPSYCAVKAISVPSGENVGAEAVPAVDAVSLEASPPRRGTRQRSPAYSKTTLVALTV